MSSRSKDAALTTFQIQTIQILVRTLIFLMRQASSFFSVSVFNFDQEEFFNAILHITLKLVDYYHMYGSSSATGSYYQTLIDNQEQWLQLIMI